MSIEANMCACCKEIWNQYNLKTINISTYKLYLCPGCYNEYKNILKQVYTDGQKNPHKSFKNWLYENKFGCMKLNNE